MSMNNFVIIEKSSRLIQQDQHGMLCIFIDLADASRFIMDVSDRPAHELEVVKCEIIKPRKA